jgi:Ni,Fe-hydrogenase I cytochrome b subunit
VRIYYTRLVQFTSVYARLVHVSPGYIRLVQITSLFRLFQVRSGNSGEDKTG